MYHRRRPQASGGADRRNPSPAHLGFVADASSPRAWHRPRRWFIQDAERWVACKPGFPPPSIAARGCFAGASSKNSSAYRSGRLQFFGEYAALANPAAFADWLAPLGQSERVAYAKRPFAGPAAVLAYLSRYTHRVAISNRRLIALDKRGVTFRWKDYRAKANARYKTMTLGAEEFMRRFLLHVLPSGFHRIRHYGLIANAQRNNYPRAGA